MRKRVKRGQGQRVTKKAKYGAAGCRMDGNNTYRYEKLLDFRVDCDLGELVLVEWTGGIRSWHTRASLECDASCDDLELISQWHYLGRRGKFVEFRAKELGKLRYTDSHLNNCGIQAAKKAFELLGRVSYVSDSLVEDFLHSGDYKDGLKWPEVYHFVKKVNNSLGHQPHPHLRKLRDNLRKYGEHGVKGIRALVQEPGVFLARFCKASVGHIVVVEAVRRNGDLVVLVHDDYGCFTLEESAQWIDGSDFQGLHQLLFS